jgi:hypothetical protein
MNAERVRVCAPTTQGTLRADHDKMKKELRLRSDTFAKREAELQVALEGLKEKVQKRAAVQVRDWTQSGYSATLYVGAGGV